MSKNKDITIIIPCYNEFKSLDVNKYNLYFKENPNAKFCFVNDGSSDSTLKKLESLRSSNVHVLNLKKNCGKAEAVRQGMHYSLAKLNSPYFGFFDADLSTPLSEIDHLHNEFILASNLEMVFGSRILKVGSKIDRKRSRFLIGRIIATFISKVLQLKVYDTQCGAKLFRKELAEKIFKEQFISKWLFDVELIFRVMKIYGREATITGSKIKEVALNIWEEKGNSKIKWTYGFRVFVDLYQIKKAYKNL